MQMKKNFLKAAIAGVVMLATAGAAFAAPATSTANVNVRSGPGTGYSVVDVLKRGDRVEVTNCQGGWCYVEKRGTNGWVSASYLNARGGNSGGSIVRPGVSIEFNFGNRPAPQRPLPPPPRPPRPGHGGWDGGWNGHGGWDRYDDRRDWGNHGPRRPRDWN